MSRHSALMCLAVCLCLLACGDPKGSPSDPAAPPDQPAPVECAAQGMDACETHAECVLSRQVRADLAHLCTWPEQPGECGKRTDCAPRATAATDVFGECWVSTTSCLPEGWRAVEHDMEPSECAVAMADWPACPEFLYTEPAAEPPPSPVPDAGAGDTAPTE